ncbi:LysM peptidoglycan-binding domain-containing protein [Stappia sp. TSB10GB4]|uniref:LysM peptidoglycan-binding domain-containing protein n=1 Tax=Stappia sp. TSB10GB4 TaxID=2003584 RepID=UPI0016462D8A|nr:LysM peptidoglycan-binding domain-containing protein [Stappia sp. TSB10GB4]
MSQKLIIQLLVLLGLVGAGAVGYHLSQKDDGPARQTAEAPATGEAATQTAATEAPAKTEEPQAAATPQDTTDIGGKTADERIAALPSFDLMRVEPDGSAVVAGRSEAGAIVALLANGQVVGRGIANAAGEFAIVLDEPLPPGAHAVTLETRDADGKVLNESSQSMAVSVPQDRSAGEVLVMLNEPGAPSQILQKPQQIADAGAAADQATSGQAAPQQATSDQPGDAPAGTQDVAAAPQAATGSESEQASAGQGAPAQDLPQSDAPAQPQLADAAPSGTGTTEPAAAGAQQTAEAPTPAESVDTPAAGAAAEALAGTVPADSDATPTVTVEAVEAEGTKVFVAGSGQPNSNVRVYLDNQLVGEARTDAQGRWLLETQGEVNPGEVALRADQVTAGDGAVAARAEVTFEKAADEAVILRPVALSGEAGAGSGASGDAGSRQIPSVIIRTGDNLWTISQRRYGAGIRYTTIYQANKDQIRNPDLIYPGQVFMLPEGDRNWPAERSTGG